MVRLLTVRSFYMYCRTCVPAFKTDFRIYSCMNIIETGVKYMCILFFVLISDVVIFARLLIIFKIDTRHLYDKKHLIYHNRTSVQRLLQNQLQVSIEYFSYDKFSIYIYGFAYVNKLGNLSIVTAFTKYSALTTVFAIIISIIIMDFYCSAAFKFDIKFCWKTVLLLTTDYSQVQCHVFLYFYYNIS